MDLDANGPSGRAGMQNTPFCRRHWNGSDMRIRQPLSCNPASAHLDAPQPRHYLRLHLFEE